MAKTNLKCADATLLIDRFTGINGETLVGSDTCVLENFRVLSDGTLLSRGGFRLMTHFTDAIRGVFRGRLSGAERIFVAAGNRVYEVDPATGAATELATIGTSTGECVFSLLRGRVILADGTEYYLCAHNLCEPVNAYVPLYGYRWKSGSTPANEALNLLSPHVRVIYYSTSTTTSLPLGTLTGKIKRVDGVRYLQNSNTPPNLTISSLGNTLSASSSVLANNELEVSMTLKDENVSPLGATLKQCRHLFADDLFCGGATVLYGSEADPDTMYFCRTGAAESVSPSYGQILPLYVTSLEDSAKTCGADTGPINGILRYNGIFLIQQERQIWIHPASDQAALSLTLPEREVGAQTIGTICRVGEELYSYSEGTLLKWTPEQDDTTGEWLLTVKKLSEAVEDLLPVTFPAGARLFSWEPYHQIWLWSPGVNKVFVFDTRTGGWSTYGGFTPTALFGMGKDAAFGTGNDLCVMDGTRTADQNGQGLDTAITSVWQSGWMDFGHAEETKRLVRVVISAASGVSGLKLILENEQESNVTFLCPGTADPDLPICFDKRAYLGRSRFLRLRLEATGTDPVRIFSIRLAVTA